MNYAIKQRMRFIDYIINHFGLINRKHLSDYFGIAEAQATRDFKMYEHMAPGNVVYSGRDKCWLRGPDFKRLYSGDEE